jgi:hypothetical protein
VKFHKGRLDAPDKLALANALKAGLASVLGAPESPASVAQSSVNTKTIPALRLGRMLIEPGRAGARTLGAGVGRAIGRGIKR